MKDQIFKFCAMLLIPLLAVINCPIGSLAADEEIPVETKIKHKPVEQVVAGERIPVEVKVTDESGVEVVRAYFKATDAEAYSFVPLKPAEDDTVNGLLFTGTTFKGTLPAAANGAESFNYLILVKNGNNQVVKSQTYNVTVEDNDDAEQAVAGNEQIEVYTELKEAPAEITGFSDNIAIDVVESAAKLGVVAGIYSAATAGSSASGAVAGGTVASSMGLSTTAIVAGAAVATAVTVGGVAAATGGGSSSSSAATAQCNSTTTNGGDQPETHRIALGKSSGRFGFSWNNGGGIPDRIIVSVGGRTVFDTGCTAGTGSRSVAFSGGSIATVQVQPNCAGNTSNTYWQFRLACP